MQLRFEVGGIPIRVQGQGPLAENIARRLLGGVGRESQPDQAPLGELMLTLHAATALPPAPVGAEPIAQLEEAGVTIDRSGTTYHLRTAEMTVDVDAEGGWATAVILGDDREAPLPEGGLLLLLFGLGVLLRPHHLYPLQAAALVHEGRGVLFIAPSGSGKSRLAMSLVGEGWSLLTDEALLLRPGAEHVEAIPFHRTPGLMPDAIARFPKLARAPRGGPPPEQGEGAPAGSAPAGRAAQACVPRLLVFPEVGHFRRSRLEPLRRSEALLRLANQSGLLALSALWTREHLDVLRHLAAQTVAYRLVAGRDFLADPGKGAEMLLAVLPPSAATLA